MGGLGRGVAALSRQRQCSDINMNSCNGRDSEIHNLLIIMGEKVMQSHNAFNKDVERRHQRSQESGMFTWSFENTGFYPFLF